MNPKTGKVYYSQRGTSKHEDVMNTSIMLVPAAKEDLGEHEGFRVLFTKHRGFVPEAIAAVAIVFEEGEARLVCAPDLEARKAEKARVIQVMNALRMVVPASSLGDVHSMVLYPVMSSHRDLSPKHRQRMGIRDNLVRLSVGIEAAEDIIADLEQALA